jgi:hypothetical protein
VPVETRLRTGVATMHAGSAVVAVPFTKPSADAESTQRHTGAVAGSVGNAVPAAPCTNRTAGAGTKLHMDVLIVNALLAAADALCTSRQWHSRHTAGVETKRRLDVTTADAQGAVQDATSTSCLYR